MSNVSLAGGTAVDLTGAGGALAGASNATEVQAIIQTALGKMEQANTGGSAAPVLITNIVQQAVTPTTVSTVIDAAPIVDGTRSVDLSAFITPPSAAENASTVAIVAIQAPVATGGVVDTIFIPTTFQNVVIKVTGDNPVRIVAQGTGGQNTVMDGGGGGDFLLGDAGDTINGGAGDDTVGAFFGNASIGGGIGNDLVMGGSGVDTLTGGDGNDTVVGSTLGVTAGADSMDGGAGDDLLYGMGSGANIFVGGDGADSLVGGTGADSMSGGTGNDILISGAGADTLSGGDGNDNMQGGAGNDSLMGGAGDDTLWGGAGADTLVGGTGADIFYLRELGAGSNTTINDYSGTEGDRLHFTGVTQLTVGAASGATGTTATVALSGSNTVITMPDGSTITLVGINALPANSVIYG